VALVTGASKGIGRAVALRLARDGMAVAIGYLRDRDGAQSVLDDLRAAGGAGLIVRADLGTVDGPGELVRATEDALGGVDVLVNNAAIFPLSDWDAIPLEQWERVFNVNVRGGYLAARAAAEGMASRGWGRIVFMSSGTFLTGSPRLTDYAASKGAVVGLTRSLALALGDHGITVNAVTTGRTLTEGLTTLFEQGETTLDESIMSRGSQAIKRLAMPDDIAGVFAFLASDDSAYLTGQLINVDGGRNMH
jgi:NAD(P)-dependent dehydrogenase (short-subunit alcohol dehydrogenase family)